MTNNERPPISELEPREVVVDETGDLLNLYDLESPEEDDVKNVLSQHYARFGRIGLIQN